MNILVTGYKGFIGQNMCHYLMSRGHKVEGWDFMDNAVPDPSGYDWVIHLGAISDTTFTDVEQIMAQNFENSMRLLQTCDTMGTNIQYASSASVYGPTTHFNEDGNLLPQSPYAWSKYLFDRFVKQHLDDFKVIVQGFRYFNVYGPYEDHKGNQASPYTKFTKQAQEDKIIKVFEGSENYKRDFICVNDVCQIHEKMFQIDKSGIWNVGTGKPVSFDTVARTIADKHGAEIKYITMPDNLKSQYQKYTCADFRRTKIY